MWLEHEDRWVGGGGELKLSIKLLMYIYIKNMDRELLN